VAVGVYTVAGIDGLTVETGEGKGEGLERVEISVGEGPGV